MILVYHLVSKSLTFSNQYMIRRSLQKGLTLQRFVDYNPSLSERRMFHLLLPFLLKATCRVERVDRLSILSQLRRSSRNQPPKSSQGSQDVEMPVWSMFFELETFGNNHYLISMFDIRAWLSSSKFTAQPFQLEMLENWPGALNSDTAERMPLSSRPDKCSWSGTAVNNKKHAHTAQTLR